MLTAPFLQMEQAFLQGSTDTAKASWSLGAPSREAVWFLQLFREGPKRRAHPQNGAWLSIPTKKTFNSVVGLLICCFRRSEKRPHKWNITTGTTPWVAPASYDGDVMSKLLWITSSIHKRSSRLVVFMGFSDSPACWAAGLNWNTIEPLLSVALHFWWVFNGKVPGLEIDIPSIRSRQTTNFTNFSRDDAEVIRNKELGFLSGWGSVSTFFFLVGSMEDVET